MRITSKKRARHRMTVSIDAETYRRLIERARAERRSVSAQTEVAIEEALQKQPTVSHS